MIRVSECKYSVALVYTSGIRIEKSETFLEKESFDVMTYWGLAPASQRRRETEFQITEGRYLYLEWPPLDHNYIESKMMSSEVDKEHYIEPYFLTVDDQGRIRIHYIKEKTEEIVRKDEFYRCGTFLTMTKLTFPATFSLDGRHIYAINDKQEVCKIDFQDFSIVMKRKIEELANPEEVMSSHIMQVTPFIFAIGSILKAQVVNSQYEANFKPYLHLVSGDLLDPKRELTIKAFEIPSFVSDPNRAVIFRSLYVKERGLLLFGHSNSQKIITLNFGFDGSVTEIHGPNLLFTVPRGIALMREEKPARGQQNKDRVAYRQKTLRLPKPPKFLVLDSKGYVHVFCYYDTRYASSALSMYTRPLSIQEFKEKEILLKEKLNSREKIRSKSQSKRVEVISSSLKWKKRSKSQAQSKDSHSKHQITLEEKQRLLKNLKRSHSDNKTKIAEPSLSQKPQDNGLFAEINLENSEKTLSSSSFSLVSGSLSKKAENPFLLLKNTEEKSAIQETSKTTNSLFSSAANSLFSSSLKKTENQPLAPETESSTNSLFSSSSSSLFGSSSSSKLNFTFQKPVSKETKEEARSSLFTSTKRSNGPIQNLGFDSANLFSSNTSDKTFLKVFKTTEDPAQKKAFLFLNKSESDVLFKVEDQEFPAHKYILSERCRFFKNMFESGMLESYSSVIVIPETKASLFKAFLEYVYLGQTVLNEDLALNLMDFSEKYIIADLKVACENCLHNYLTVDNCVKIFETACLYDAPSLKKRTIFFFQINYKKILDKHKLDHLPLMSHRYLLKTYWKYNPILGPSISDLIINQTLPSQSTFLESLL